MPGGWHRGCPVLPANARQLSSVALSETACCSCSWPPCCRCSHCPLACSPVGGYCPSSSSAPSWCDPGERSGTCPPALAWHRCQLVLTGLQRRHRERHAAVRLAQAHAQHHWGRHHGTGSLQVGLPQTIPAFASPAGTYQPYLGQAAGSACLACPDPEFTSYTGADDCTVPVVTVCPDGERLAGHDC